MNICSGPIPVSPMARVCCRLIAGIAGMYPADGMDVRLFSLLRVVQVAPSATGCSLVHRSSTGCV